MEIIKQLDKGEKLTDLAKYYGVGCATIRTSGKAEKTLSGWMDKLKKCLEIHFQTITETIEELGHGLDQVYNADESGLFSSFCLIQHLFIELKKVHPTAKFQKTE
ncbi:hypothetical protein J437_LFUL017332 [Ladona fulva]|uniref:Uncharacterized protein n=1 Tax=Ladona fulva TaxID=123851 RepID=A0A8K0KLZ7_LADFU|nr:hypothetical protein J437_LFUL017332 [Ladona fulva]